MKENMHVIPVVKILRQTLISDPSWKIRICGLKNQEATCCLNFLLQTLLLVLQNFVLSIYFVRCAVLHNTCPLNDGGKNAEPYSMDYPDGPS